MVDFKQQGSIEPTIISYNDDIKQHKTNKPIQQIEVENYIPKKDTHIDLTSDLSIPIVDKPLTQDSTMEELFFHIANNVDLILDGKDFDIGKFLSASDFGEDKISKTKSNVYQVADLLADVAEKTKLDLRTILTEYKRVESENKLPKKLMVNTFLIRTALLLENERSGAEIKSWEVYTKATDLTPNNADFWPWLENNNNWIPESQAAAAKFNVNATINALHLSKANPKAEVIAYKGGFGAGKTSHGKKKFGDRDVGHRSVSNFIGAVSPDASKDIIRRSLPEVSHASAHTQASNTAFNMFDSLIKISTVLMPSGEEKIVKKELGAIVYDSSLASHTDILNLIDKSEKANKSLQIIEVSRYDLARSLAVLARKVDGQDPRIPLSHILYGASKDRKYRANCMNAIINSNPLEIKGEMIPHRYDFNCSNSQGSDSKLVCILQSGQEPNWQIDQKEALERLNSIGLLYNSNTNQFENINPTEKWEDVLQQDLKKSIDELLPMISSAESQVREDEFSKRVLPFIIQSPVNSPNELYKTLDDNFKQCISQESFISSFNCLDATEKTSFINKINNLAMNNQTISYMNLPAAFALELNSKIISTPEAWYANT